MNESSLHASVENGALTPANLDADRVVPESDPQPSDSPDPSFAADPPLAALQQLPREQHRPYTAFMAWALAQAPMSVAEIAACNNVSVATINRWKRFYRWEFRVAQYHQLRLQMSSVAVGPTLPALACSRPACPPTQPATAMERGDCDFRAEALALARSALRRWQQSVDDEVTLPGVTRALELALKLTGQDQLRDAEEKSSKQEFHAMLDRLYGEKARSQTAAAAAAAHPQPEMIGGKTDESRSKSII